MNHLQWANNTFKNEKSQIRLEDKLNLLLNGPLNKRDDYGIEKCIKSFCEGLSSLESVLLYQREIHPYKMENMYWVGKEALYTKRWLEVEEIIKTEINRQYRHFVSFL